MEAEPRVTREELIRAGDAIRPGATDRLITDWVELGLLDRPYKPGSGRGAGSKPGTWPVTQKALFEMLWKQRPHLSIPGLCNFPVYSWLYWGDQYVPLRQVRRVMRTWLARFKKLSRPQAEGAATRVMKIVEEGRPNPARRGLVTEALIGDRPDLEQIRGQIISQARESQPKITLESGRLFEVDGQAVMNLITAQVATEHAFDSLSDTDFEWARFFMHCASAQYALDQPTLASNTRHGWLFPARQLQDLVMAACSNLNTALGVSLAVPIAPHLKGTFLDPSVWKKGNVHGVILSTDVRDDGMAVEFDVVVN